MTTWRRFAAAVNASAILLLGFCTPAQALRSTDIWSFTEPGFAAFRPARIVLLAIAEDAELRAALEERVSAKLEAQGIDVVQQSHLFPQSSRDRPAEEIEAVLKQEAIDSGVIVAVGANATDVIHFATRAYASAEVFGNFRRSSGSTSGAGRFVGKSDTGVIFSHASFGVVMLDVNANRVIWYADVVVDAGGSLFVDLERDARDAAQAVAKGLLDDGHIAK